VTVQKLETFHHHSVRSIMEIRKTVQWPQHISSIQLAKCFGVRGSISNLLGLARLRWLGHVAQIPNDHIPKKDFVWIATSNKACPWCEVKMARQS